MTWYIVYTCISYSIYTHSPVGKQRTFVVAPWCAIRPRCSFYRWRVRVGLASQGFFHAFFCPELDWFCLFLFSVCDDAVWLTSFFCGGGVECGGLITSKTLLEFPTRSWCYAVTQLFLGTSNTLLSHAINFLLELPTRSWCYAVNFHGPSLPFQARHAILGAKPLSEKKHATNWKRFLGWFGRFI